MSRIHPLAANETLWDQTRLTTADIRNILEYIAFSTDHELIQFKTNNKVTFWPPIWLFTTSSYLPKTQTHHQQHNISSYSLLHVKCRTPFKGDKGHEYNIRSYAQHFRWRKSWFLRSTLQLIKENIPRHHNIFPPSKLVNSHRIPRHLISISRPQLLHPSRSKANFIRLVALQSHLSDSDPDQHFSLHAFYPCELASW